MQVKAPRGTYDILPEDSARWQRLERIMQETADIFGYREIRTPLFEHTELFHRGVGDTTDIVTKEMYTFDDRGGRSLSLRPEGTASCVRALIEHSQYAGILPVKWYYTGPMFRYDRPQSGRYRQFHQFGVEAFGVKSPYIDAEVILLMIEILKRLGLHRYELHLNSVGCPSCRAEYRAKLMEFIAARVEQLCSDCLVRYEKNPLRVLDCKQPQCGNAISGHPNLVDHLCEDCRTHYQKLQDILRLEQVNFVHNDKLVRGLDYYTNTAFEAFVPHVGGALGGGGRYDGLAQLYGGPDLPGIGFAMGMERMLLALETADSERADNGVFITLMNGAYQDIGFKLLGDLRRQGFRAEMDFTGKSGKAQMKHAGKMGAGWVILLGDDEINNSFYTVRNMKNQEQIQIGSEELLTYLGSILGKDEMDEKNL